MGRPQHNTIWARGSQTVVAFVHAARKRRRTMFIAAAVIALLAVIAAFVSFRYLQAEAATAVRNGYGSLNQCLLGAVGDNKQPASVRFRALQLTALTQSDILRTDRDKLPWPDRCASYAHKLHEGVNGSAIADTENGKALADAAVKLAAALEKKDAFHADLSATVDALFQAAAKAAISAASVPDIPAPPKPAAALNVDSLTGALSNSPVDLAAIQLPPTTGETVQILVSDKNVAEGPFHCVIKPGQASCRRIAKPAAQDGQLALSGSAAVGAAPALFGKTAVYAGDSGAVLSDTPAVSGYTSAGGVIDLLRSDGRLSFWSRIEEGRERKLPIFLPGMTVPEPAQDLRMFGAHLMLRVQKRDEQLLLATRIESGRLLPPVEVGPIDAKFGPLDRRRLTACSAGKSDVVRLAGENQSFLSFRQDNTWSAPVKAMPGKVSFGCQAGRATLARHNAGSSGQLGSKLEVESCDAKACKRSAIVMRSLLTGELGLVPAGNMDTVSVDDALAISWLAGQRGGVRLRVAPSDKLAGSPDVIAFDNLLADGKVQTISTIADMRSLPGRGYAVLLLGTTKGLRAVTFDAKGRVEPVAVNWLQ